MTFYPAIVCLEHILTFGHEYNYLWKRRWNAATWLFAVNRYVLLAVTILYVAPKTPMVSLL